MKVNFKTELKNLKGNPIKLTQDANSPPATLGDVCTMALLADSQDDLTKKLACFKLAQAIENGVDEITAPQSALLQEKIGAQQNPLIVGVCAALLEG